MQSTVQVEFQDEHLWRQPEQIMEMIANKEGTPLTPGIAFSVNGLDEDGKYEVKLSMERVGYDRYTYTDGMWQISTKRKAAPMYLNREVSHKDGVKTGKEWMSEIIKFDEVRITNNKSNESKDNFIFTETMHLYRPVITFKNIDTTKSPIYHSDPLFNFIPVTIYQHTSIGKWKAKNNKFATKRHGGLGSDKKEKKVRAPTPTTAVNVKAPVNIVPTPTNPIDNSVFAGCSSKLVSYCPNLKPFWNQDEMKNQRNALAPKENIQPADVTINPVVPPSDFVQMDPSSNQHYNGYYSQPTMPDYSLTQQYSNDAYYPPIYNNYWNYTPTAYYPPIGGNENIPPQPQYPFYY
ncbi:hypothetical protein GCK72_008933 [Caenorhabditis remanei]|uniref:T-box domain-containing protein n=1 Tax=Caenorhabditis remanei TaxID=31234 RepID=A0A6A5H1N7_CAERE|nr:hypothetical protein GCK72_008933 [Caenorhabditis remanei]KAF1760684.1 hypothetical protein GCK72_008933 [Caenorhabditis remanei]